MSVRALAWAFEQHIDATAKLVLLALADHSSEDGDCWVGMKTLGAKTGLKERAIQTACKRLEGAGLIRKSPRFHDGRQTTNLWEVVFRSVAKQPQVPAPDAPTPPHQMRGTPAPYAPPGAHQMHPNNHTDEPSTLTKQPPKPPKGGSGRERKAFDPGEFDSLIPVELARSGEFVGAWHTWMADRRERKQTVTEAAATLQLKRLEAEAGSPEAAVLWIRNAIEKGWRGLYRPTESSPTRGRPASPNFRSAADKALANQLARKGSHGTRTNLDNATDPGW